MGYKTSSVETWNIGQEAVRYRIDTVPSQPDPLAVGAGAHELLVAPPVAPDGVEHSPEARRTSATSSSPVNCDEFGQLCQVYRSLGSFQI